MRTKTKLIKEPSPAIRKRLRRQRPYYGMLLTETFRSPITTLTDLEPAEARAAIVAMSGLNHTELAEMVGGTRQLITTVLAGAARSDRVERAICKLYGMRHELMFPEPRSRKPRRTHLYTGEQA